MVELVFDLITNHAKRYRTVGAVYDRQRGARYEVLTTTNFIEVPQPTLQPNFNNTKLSTSSTTETFRSVIQ